MARCLSVPSQDEISEFEPATDPDLRVAVAAMSGMGLRIGGLPGLSIYQERFSTVSKGGEHAGKIPVDVRKDIERAGLSMHSPFAALTAAQMIDHFRYLARKLHAEGKLRERHSVHGLRHAFAVRLYRETKDIYQAEKALGHADVAVTEGYLRSQRIGA